MKMTKAQEDFLGICWNMKVVNIIPQAAKLGIPEDEVRKYLATKGLTIEEGGFVFQGTKLEPEEGRVKAEDFMAAVEVANRKYQAEVRKYARLEKGWNAKEGFDAQQAKLKETGKEVQYLHDQIVWLVGGLLAPGGSHWGRLARKTMAELLKSKRNG